MFSWLINPLFLFAAKLEGGLFLTHLRMQLNPSWSIHAEKYKIATLEYFNNNNKHQKKKILAANSSNAYLSNCKRCYYYRKKRNIIENLYLVFFLY